jgi:hypothetical protein
VITLSTGTNNGFRLSAECVGADRGSPFGASNLADVFFVGWDVWKRRRPKFQFRLPHPGDDITYSVRKHNVNLPMAKLRSPLPVSTRTRDSSRYAFCTQSSLRGMRRSGCLAVPCKIEKLREVARRSCFFRAGAIPAPSVFRSLVPTRAYSRVKLPSAATNRRRWAEKANLPNTEPQTSLPPKIQAKARGYGCRFRQIALAVTNVLEYERKAMAAAWHTRRK